MGHFLKGVQRFGAGALRGRIRRHQFRMRRFQVYQFPVQRIILGVADHRRIQDVIAVQMIIDFVS